MERTRNAKFPLHGRYFTKKLFVTHTVCATAFDKLLQQKENNNRKRKTKAYIVSNRKSFSNTTISLWHNEWFQHLPYMDISSSGESPFVVAAHTECRCAPSASCFSAHVMRIRALLILQAVQGSTMEPERGNSKSEKLRKQKAVTPHRPTTQPRQFQADQQETELRQHRTFRKWRHNLAVYYANLHGSCSTVQSLLRR